MSQPKYRCSLEVKLFGPSNCRYLSTSDCYVKTDCPNALVAVARSCRTLKSCVVVEMELDW